MKREFIVIHLRDLKLFTPCNGKRMRSPKSDTGNIKVNMLARSEFPGASQFLQQKKVNDKELL